MQALASNSCTLRTAGLIGVGEWDEHIHVVMHNHGETLGRCLTRPLIPTICCYSMLRWEHAFVVAWMKRHMVTHGLLTGIVVNMQILQLHLPL
jgi:hypothetical protein